MGRLSSRAHALSKLERELHESFHVSRLPRNDFDHELLARLDEYCPPFLYNDADDDNDPKTPLALVGPPGCGKTTLLAVWLQRRREKVRRSAEFEFEEFRFSHVVGCTRQSVLVRELLTRLSTEVLDHFDLPKPKNFNPDKLAWDLPRLLETASRKGRVLIVIDGLHRLRNDKGEINLKWLPLTFPSNVHVVVTTSTLPEQYGTTTKRKSIETKIKKRMLSELERRQWQFVTMSSLSPKVRSSILDNYLTPPKEARTSCESSACDVGDVEFLATLTENASRVVKVTEREAEEKEKLERAVVQERVDAASRDDEQFPHILNLFVQQYEALLNVPTNALSLATFLRSLQCSAQRGFDLWELIDAWLQKASLKTPPASEDVAAPLFDAILESWESGHVAMAHKRERARRKSAGAGPTIASLTSVGEGQLIESGNMENYSSILGQLFACENHASHTSDGYATARTLSRVRRKTVASVGIHDSDDNLVKESVEKFEAPLPQSRPTAAKNGGEDYGDDDDFEDEYDDEDGFHEDSDNALDDKDSSAHSVGDQESEATVPIQGSGAGNATAASWDETTLKANVTSCEEVPKYLLGGADRVPGLGMLLGDALSFLYVARYGLRENELWALLEELERDRKSEVVKRQKKEMATGNGTKRASEHGLRESFDIYAAPAPSSATDQTDELDELVDMLAMEDEFGKTSSNRSTTSSKVAAFKLPTLLHALGVIHDAEAGVFVLPLESEALRMVVKHRYIDDGPFKSLADNLGEGNPRDLYKQPEVSGSDEATSGGDRWHARLAGFFARQHPSRRRAEELPWHLKHCRQWSSLRDTLANVPTFETMFHGSPQMRHELQEYWRLLADGPLYLTRRAERSAAVLTAEGTANRALLHALDEARALGKRDSQARNDRLVDQSATFDVVEAYNKAIEAWTESEKPTTHRLAEAMRAIGEFLYEFDEKSRESPLFLRGAVNTSRLADLGISEETPATFGLVSPPESVNPTPSTPVATVRRSGIGTPGEVSNTGPTASVLDDQDEDDKRSIAGYVPPKIGTVVKTMTDLLANVRGADDPSAPAACPGSGKNRMSISKHYCYQRWMWIQFPWLTLAHAAAASWAIGRKYAPEQNASAEATRDGAADKVDEVNDDKRLVYPASQIGRKISEAVDLTTPPATRALDAANTAVVNYFSGPKDRRYWLVKRRAPNVSPTTSSPEKGLRTHAKDAKLSMSDQIMKNLKRDAAAADIPSSPTQVEKEYILSSSQLRTSCEAVDIHLTSPDERQRLRLDRVAARRPPRRMRWKPTPADAGKERPNSASGDGMAANDSEYGPYSASSLRSRLRGTRFPSAQAQYAASILERSESCDLYGPRATTRFGGKAEPSELKHVILERELERLDSCNASDALLGSLAARSVIFPATHEEKVAAQSKSSLNKLRSTYDKLVAERKRKQRAFDAIETDIEAQRAIEDQCADQLRRGEATLSLLDDRLAVARAAIAESTALGSYFSAIANLAEESRPMRGEARLSIIEEQLALARTQAAELLKKRKELLDNAARVAELPRLRRERKKWKSLRAIARRRLARATRDLGVAAEASLEAEPTSPKPSPYEAAERRQQELLRMQELRRQSMEEVEEATEALSTTCGPSEHERLTEALALAAGVSIEEMLDQDEIAEKYDEAQVLNADLLEKNKAAMSRLEQLRTVHDVMCSEFSEIKLGGTIDSKRKAGARGREESTVKAELALNQNQRYLERVVGLIARACSGILHIAHLVEVHTGETISNPSFAEDVEKKANSSKQVEESAIVDLLARIEANLLPLVAASAEKGSLPTQAIDPASSSEYRKVRLAKVLETPLPPKRKLYETLVNQLDPETELRQDEHVAAAGARVETGTMREDKLEQRNKELEKLDAELEAENVNVRPEPYEKIAEAFIHQGLTTSEATAALRRANAASKLKQGPRAPLGLALNQALKVLPKVQTPFSNVSVGVGPLGGEREAEVGIPDRSQIKSKAERIASEAIAHIHLERLADE